MNDPHLSGHSGATLRILSCEGHAIVRKSAASIKGNERLMRQMEKQQDYIRIESAIRTPVVLDSGIDEMGRFYFDMEFIPGLDGHRFLETCTPAELHSFISKLSAHLLSMNRLPCIGKPGCHSSLFDACVAKLIEIHHQHVGLTDELAGRILGLLDCVRHLNLKPGAFCHGDFTLENIIIDAHGDLAFVDFLDSTFEHPIQDLVKLSQDIHGGWFRMKGRRISGAYIAHLDAMLAGAARDILPEYESVKNVLQALNFSRVLPYATNESNKAYLLAQIKRFST